MPRKQPGLHSCLGSWECLALAEIDIHHGGGGGLCSRRSLEFIEIDIDWSSSLLLTEKPCVQRESWARVLVFVGTGTKPPGNSFWHLDAGVKARK